MTTIENLNGMQSDLEQITKKQKALGAKLKGAAFDVWDVMQKLVKDGLVNNTLQVGRPQPVWLWGPLS